VNWRELQYSDSGLRVDTFVLIEIDSSAIPIVKCTFSTLDTIAAALTTGNSGDVFAAALDKSNQMQLVLAKNGSPTPGDMGSATELISLIGSPAVSYAMHLFPFLIRRCGANIDKRIRNLHISNRGLHHDFSSALEEYEPGADVTAEFPSAGLGDMEMRGLRLRGHFVEEIIDMTAQGLNAGDVSSWRKKYTHIFLRMLLGTLAF
jgi:hypothetical protein